MKTKRPAKSSNVVSLATFEGERVTSELLENPFDIMRNGMRKHYHVMLWLIDQAEKGQRVCGAPSSAEEPSDPHPSDCRHLSPLLRTPFPGTMAATDDKGRT